MAALMSLMVAALSVVAPMVSGEQVMRTTCDSNPSGTIYDFHDYSLIGNKTIDLADYAGKVITRPSYRSDKT